MKEKDERKREIERERSKILYNSLNCINCILHTHGTIKNIEEKEKLRRSRGLSIYSIDQASTSIVSTIMKRHSQQINLSPDIP